MNLPNFLTLLRIFSTGVYVLLLQELPHGNYLLAIVFIVASITDGLDGYLARSRKEVTRFGKLIDPSQTSS